MTVRRPLEYGTAHLIQGKIVRRWWFALEVTQHIGRLADLRFLPFFPEDPTKMPYSRAQLATSDPRMGWKSAQFPTHDSVCVRPGPMKSQAPTLDPVVLAEPPPAAGFVRNRKPVRAASFPFCPRSGHNAQDPSKTYSRKHMRMLHSSIASVRYCALAA